MSRNISKVTDSQKHPERFPFTYSTLRQKHHDGSLKGIVFHHSNRLWFDHDEWDKQMEDARLASLK